MTTHLGSPNIPGPRMDSDGLPYIPQYGPDDYLGDLGNIEGGTIMSMPELSRTGTRRAVVVNDASETRWGLSANQWKTGAQIATAGVAAWDAYTSYTAGRAEAKAHMARAQAIDYAAQETGTQASRQIRRTRTANRRYIGSMRAALGSSGTVMSTGSARDTMREADLRLETRIIDQTRAAESQVRKLNQQARLARYQADSAKYRGGIGAVSSILSGATKVMTLGMGGA